MVFVHLKKFKFNPSHSMASEKTNPTPSSLVPENATTRQTPSHEVRRRLDFGQRKEEEVEHNLSACVDIERERERQRAREKWNFDFENEVPLEGDWEWEKVGEGQVLEFKDIVSSKTKTSKKENRNV